MKSPIIVLLAAAGTLASARTITVPTQPASPWLDIGYTSFVMKFR